MTNKGEQHTGGRGGIRTHGALAGTPVFKTGALNHSATLPSEEDQSLIGDRVRTQCERGPKSDPKYLFPQEARGESSDRVGNRLIGLLRPLPLGIVPKRDGRVVADALGDPVHRNAGVEEGGGVDAAQVVKAGLAEPQDADSDDVARVYRFDLAQDSEMISPTIPI